MKADNVIRVIQTVLAAGVAAFAISVVVAGHWWEPPPSTVDVSKVGDQVVGLLRDQWSSNDKLKPYGIIFENHMTLINTGLNKYDGLATARTHKGTQEFLSVTVWADPTGAMFYQMDPGSASNLIDAAKQEGGWGS